MDNYSAPELSASIQAAMNALAPVRLPGTDGAKLISVKAPKPTAIDDHRAARLR